MIYDKDGKTDLFELKSELFPAFRKAKSVTKELAAEEYEPAAKETRQRGSYVKSAAGPAGAGAVSPPPEELLFPPAADVKERGPDEKEEKIPALFGDVCLDKYKKHEEPEHEQTLLEFLNQPLHDYNQPLDESPLPVPSLFEGIGREYYASEEVLRLAAEAEAEEKEKNAAAADSEADGDMYSVDDAVKEVEAPPPDPSELFGMISSIYEQQREDWDRHVYESHMAARRQSDPYNTLFNNRQPVINYENIDEFPMGEKYTLTPVESRKKPVRAKERPRQPGGRRHFKI